MVCICNIALSEHSPHLETLTSLYIIDMRLPDCASPACHEFPDIHLHELARACIWAGRSSKGRQQGNFSKMKRGGRCTGMHDSGKLGCCGDFMLVTRHGSFRRSGYLNKLLPSPEPTSTPPQIFNFKSVYVSILRTDIIYALSVSSCRSCR